MSPPEMGAAAPAEAETATNTHHRPVTSRTENSLDKLSDTGPGARRPETQSVSDSLSERVSDSLNDSSDDRSGASSHQSSRTASRAVSWWETHLFVTRVTAHAADLPTAGTTAWLALSDDDPRKLLALAVAGEHHVLRVETAQEQLAEASKDVSAAIDWVAFAQRNHARTNFRARRPWMNRKSTAS